MLTAILFCDFLLQVETHT